MIAGLKSVLRKVKEAYVLGEVNRKWRYNNAHNDTRLISDIDQDRVHVGLHTYGDLNIYTFSSKQDLFIGNFCSIADDVVFLLAGNHTSDTISTFPFKKRILNNEAESLSKGNIIVEDDVWIGKRAIILSGVHIGQGSIIAAGAVVTKDIPPYSIVAGVPAKVIKKRFSNDVIEKVNHVNWEYCNDDFLKSNEHLLYERIDSSNVDKIVKCFPQKEEKQYEE